MLDNTAGSTLGTDLPESDGLCSQLPDPMTVHPVSGEVLYGLAVDINLDGIVDGDDLSILASRFGQ